MATSQSRGRPRSYSEDKALEAAMCSFWSMGYEGASIDRLCRDMQMSRSSLYQLFGDKQGLFMASVDHYAESRLAPVAAALGPKGDLTEDLGAFFDAVIALATSDARTPGCLISCVLADAAGANPDFRAELAHRYDALEGRIAARLRAAGWSDADDPAPAAAAVLVASIARGLMLRARAGASRDELRPAADAAVRACSALAGTR